MAKLKKEMLLKLVAKLMEMLLKLTGMPKAVAVVVEKITKRIDDRDLHLLVTVDEEEIDLPPPNHFGSTLVA